MQKYIYSFKKDKIVNLIKVEMNNHKNTEIYLFIQERRNC